jgi:hypothetical protein
VTFLPEARRNLLWILQFQIGDCHGHLWPLTAKDCSIEVQTDASDRGFGVWFQGHLHSGEWDGVDGIDTWTHINVSSILMSRCAFEERLKLTSRCIIS